MFCDKEAMESRLKKEITEKVEAQFKLTAALNEINDLRPLKASVEKLREEIVTLKAQVQIEKKNAEMAETKAKSMYAEDVMAREDIRVKELAVMYKDYTKTIVDIVQASVKPMQVLPVIGSNNK